MNSNKNWGVRLSVILLLLISSCNSSSNDTLPSTSAPPVSGLVNGTTLPVVTGNNVVNFTVNGSTCAAGSYANKPCVDVKICNVGTSTCTTVTDILLDTGSYGLRVFKSAIPNLSLSAVISKQGLPMATCAQFGVDSSTATALWGPVETADVYLGGEAAVTIPIQVVDSSWGSIPNNNSGQPECENPYDTPAEAHFNGILGVGLAAEDCGSDCVWTLTTENTDNKIYFGCTNGNTGAGNSSTAATCAGNSVSSLSDEIQNPVAAQAHDNNGLIIQLPSISSDGANAVPGYMILGIATESNNTPGSVNLYNTDSYGNINTTYQNNSYAGFLDTGSNGLLFSSNSLSQCSVWYCPGSVDIDSVTNQGAQNNAVTATAYFDVADSNALFNSSNSVFNDLGGYIDPTVGYFDFGLPFFLGRTVYIGIDNKPTTAFGGASGPYWAY